MEWEEAFFWGGGGVKSSAISIYKQVFHQMHYIKYCFLSSGNKIYFLSESKNNISILDRFPANLCRGFTFNCDVFIAGAECSFLEEQVLHDSFNTSETVGGIHIIL